MSKLSPPTEIVKKTIKIFFEKKNMILFVKLFTPLVPFALIPIIQSEYFSSPDQLKNYGLVATFSFLALANFFIYLWVWVAGVLAIKKIVAGQKVVLVEVYKKSQKMFVKFFGLSLLLFLIHLGGVLLLIIPGIIFGVWYGFSRFVFIDKNMGIVDALKESKRLVEGKFWKVFGRLILYAFLTGLVSIFISSIPYGIGAVVSTLFGALFVLPYYLLYLELEKAYKS